MSFPVAHAAAAAQALQELSDVTADPDAYEWPSDVYETLGELISAVTCLEYVLAQARIWCADEHEGGRIGHDQHPDRVDAVIDDLMAAFFDAETCAAHLGESLDAVRQITAHLTGT